MRNRFLVPALALAALSMLSAPATAQFGPGGGGGGGRGGGHGGHRQGGGEGAPGGPRFHPPVEMTPIQRSQLDEPVTAMFREADLNHDGTVTLAEFDAVVAARRDAIVKDRFARIDTNHNGQIDLAEFQAWNRQLGSAASSDSDARADGPVAEVIRPDLGKKDSARVLGLVIEPLSAIVIVNANTNYDAGVTLDELLAYERARFDKLDADHDGLLTFDEIRPLMPHEGRRGGADDGPRLGAPPAAAPENAPPAD